MATKHIPKSTKTVEISNLTINPPIDIILRNL
jgi:hypothetical protein